MLFALCDKRGIMINTISRRYGEALFNLAVQGNLVDRIQAELIELVNAYQTTSELRQLLKHPRLSMDAKSRILTQIVSGEFSPLTLKFLELLLRKNRTDYLAGVLEVYNLLTDEQRGTLRGIVRSPFMLNKAEQDKLVDRLQSRFGKKIILTIKVDRSLLGGVSVQIGDNVIDGSVRRKLKCLREQLLEEVTSSK